MVNVTPENIQRLADVGFLFVFALAALYGAVMLAKYVAKILESKDKLIEAQTEKREELVAQTIKVIENNTDAFRTLIAQLTDFMQEGRVHHKEVTGHLINLVEQRGFTQKPLRRVR